MGRNFARSIRWRSRPTSRRLPAQSRRCVRRASGSHGVPGTMSGAGSSTGGAPASGSFVTGETPTRRGRQSGDRSTIYATSWMVGRPGSTIVMTASPAGTHQSPQRHRDLHPAWLRGVGGAAASRDAQHRRRATGPAGSRGLILDDLTSGNSRLGRGLSPPGGEICTARSVVGGASRRSSCRVCAGMAD